MTALPDKTLQLMSAEDRAKLGKAGILASEAQSRIEDKSERKLQSDMVNLLNQKGLFFNRSAFHKRSTCRLGFPDFEIWFRGGRAILCEAKTSTGKLSDQQEAIHAEFNQKTGKQVYVIRDLATFKTLLDLHIALAEQ